MKKFLLPEGLISLSGPLLLVAALLLLALPAKAANAFQAAAALPEVRANFTSTLLNNGKILVAGGSGSGATALKTTALYDPVTGAWTATKSMTSTRANHTATLLPSGKVLVAGGAGSGGDAALQGFRNSGEVYDPATDTWTAATSTMSDARQFATATLLANGKVLIGGGSNSTGALKTAEIFDPALNTFSGTTAMNLARGNHTATLLASGKVLVCGGNNGTTWIQSGDLYDPAASTWTLSGTQAMGRASQTATLLTTGKVLLTGGDEGHNSQGFADLYDPAVTSGNPFTQLTNKLNTPRTRHTASLLPSGKVLIVGGTAGPNGVAVANTELFDPAAATFSPAGNLATARFSHAATLLPTGRVLISGGLAGLSPTTSAELFEPLAGSWATTGVPGSTRSETTLVGLADGRVLAIGGQTRSFSSGSALDTAEAYDSGSGTWSNAGTLTTARGAPVGVLLGTGKVLVTGGTTSSGGSATLASAELYDPAANTWSSTGSMGLSRAQCTITLLQNGKVLVAGGLSTNSPGSPFLNSAEIYDPKAGTWSPTGAMSGSRVQHTAILLTNGKVLVCGGSQGSSNTATAELYDPQTGTWSNTGSMAAARTGHSSVLLPDGRVLTMAGKTFPTSGAVLNAEIYTPATGLWTAAGTMSADRSGFQATVLYSGKVLVAGGLSASNSVVVTATEIFDPLAGTWKADAPISTGAAAFFFSDAGIFLRSGKFLLTGATYDGTSFQPLVQLYDEGRGDQPAWRPQITNAALDGYRRLAVTGSGFRGPSGASGGGVQDSSTNDPVVLWQTPGNNYGTYLALDETVGFSGTSLQTVAVPLFLGYGTATVFVNGAPSISARVFSDCSALLDSDGDGMNDLAEANAAQFGFDPLKAQPALVAQFSAAVTGAGFYTQAQYDASRTQGRNDVINSPNTYSLYSAAQIQALNVNVPLIQRDATSGLFKLTLGLGKTPALGTTLFTPFPFDVASSQIQIVNGKIEFTFPSTNGAAFFQIQSN